MRAIWFENGTIIDDGPSENVTFKYLGTTINNPQAPEISWASPSTAPGDEVARLKAVRVLNQNKQVSDSINIDEPFFVQIEYWNLQESQKPTAIIHFYNSDGICIFASNDWNNFKWRDTKRSLSIVKSTCQIPANLLTEGQVKILAAVNSYNPEVIHIYKKDIIAFQVIDRTIGTGARGEYVGTHWPGIVRPFLNWEVEVKEEPLLWHKNEDYNNG